MISFTILILATNKNKLAIQIYVKVFNPLNSNKYAANNQML